MKNNKTSGTQQRKFCSTNTKRIKKGDRRGQANLNPILTTILIFIVFTLFLTFTVFTYQSMSNQSVENSTMYNITTSQISQTSILSTANQYVGWIVGGIVLFSLVGLALGLRSR